MFKQCIFGGREPSVCFKRCFSIQFDFNSIQIMLSAGHSQLEFLRPWFHGCVGCCAWERGLRAFVQSSSSVFQAESRMKPSGTVALPARLAPPVQEAGGWDRWTRSACPRDPPLRQGRRTEGSLGTVALHPRGQAVPGISTYSLPYVAIWVNH